MFTDTIQHMGLMAYPLLACSVIALALILERLVSYYRLPKVTANQDLMAQLLNITQSLGFSNQASPPLILACIKQYLTRFIRWLQLIALISPMLGFLGTVLGLIRMFAKIAEQQAPVTPTLLADGLWQAMITTAVGLIIAIPCLLFAYGLQLWAGQYLSRLQLILQYEAKHAAV